MDDVFLTLMLRRPNLHLGKLHIYPLHTILNDLTLLAGQPFSNGRNHTSRCKLHLQVQIGFAPICHVLEYHNFSKHIKDLLLMSNGIYCTMCFSKQYEQRNWHLKHNRKDTELHPADPEHREGHFRGAKHRYSACIRATCLSVAIVQLHVAMPTIQLAQADMQQAEVTP